MSLAYVSTVPSSGEQKEQKNFRLTKECTRLLSRLAQVNGVSESALLEMLVRTAASSTDLNVLTLAKPSRRGE